MNTIQNESEVAKIKEITKWQTSDGKDFHSRHSAEIHARNMDAAITATAILESGGSVADAIRAVGEWWGSKVIQPILERVTKETKLVIAHWQCRDEPGYKPIRFKDDGTIFVHGDAGSWSGPYGGSVTPRELAEYANNKATIF